jgi:hypothetical protein
MAGCRERYIGTSPIEERLSATLHHSLVNLPYARQALSMSHFFGIQAAAAWPATQREVRRPANHRKLWDLQGPRNPAAAFFSFAALLRARI